MQRRGTFESAAERYDLVRPPYPRQIFEDLAAMAELERGSRILEIGAGTGLATEPLAERGYQVLAVELGTELAGIARRRLAAYPAVEVVVEREEPGGALLRPASRRWFSRWAGSSC